MTSSNNLLFLIVIPVVYTARDSKESIRLQHYHENILRQEKEVGVGVNLEEDDGGQTDAHEGPVLQDDGPHNAAHLPVTAAASPRLRLYRLVVISVHVTEASALSAASCADDEDKLEQTPRVHTQHGVDEVVTAQHPLLVKNVKQLDDVGGQTDVDQQERR